MYLNIIKHNVVTKLNSNPIPYPEMLARTDEAHFYNLPSASLWGTRNSRLKPVSLNCDLELVSAWLSYEFCTLSH